MRIYFPVFRGIFSETDSSRPVASLCVCVCGALFCFCAYMHCPNAISLLHQSPTTPLPDWLHTLLILTRFLIR